MRKTMMSLAMLAGTMLLVLMSLLRSGDEPVKARIVTVQRGDVHQVIALSGRIGYADESYAYALSNTSVARILVEPGQRIGAGEVLMRFSEGVQQYAASAFSEHQDVISAHVSEDLIDHLAQLDGTVLRAETDCTVRQLLVAENTPVVAGTPLIRLSSNQQEIMCAAARADAEKIEPGMWAWISAEGVSLGFAEVTEVGELTADPLTGMTSAQIMLLPEQHLALPEAASVDVEIYLAGSDDVLTLPVEAITSDGTVWWVSDGRCTEIPAEIVMSDEILAWVTLPEGIQVAIGEFVEGQRVTEAAS